MQFNEPIYSYARSLRQNQTTAEKKLWRYLRNRRLNGIKFRRQHQIAKKYIVDFFSNEKRMAIELDGKYHNIPVQKEYDQFRTDELELLRIKIIRFSNYQVLFHIEYVLEKILEACK